MPKRFTLFLILLFLSTVATRGQTIESNQIADLVRKYEADTQSMDQAYVLKESPTYYDRMEEFL